MKIIIEDYQTDWADAFDAEREVITSVLRDFNPSMEEASGISGLVASVC